MMEKSQHELWRFQSGSRSESPSPCGNVQEFQWSKYRTGKEYKMTLACRIRYSLIALLCCVPAVGTFAQPAQYFISTTSEVTLTLPVSEKKGQHLYRDAKGRWVALPKAKEGNGTVTFTLTPDQLAAGRTVVLLGKPDWLVAEDSTPPKVVKVTVDGKTLPPTETVDLGWLDRAPRTLDLQVADTQNPIDLRSIYAEVGGKTVPAGSPGLSFKPDSTDRKKGRIVCSLEKLGVGGMEGSKKIVLHCDDYAPDEVSTRSTFTFTLTKLPEINFDKPSGRTVEGVSVYVDSICPGYENVDCMLDGKLQVPGTTTFGSTWASAETPAAHWMCFCFPKPREVTGLEISWANYQNTFWTSERFAIATWDGKQWVNTLRVQKNPAQQTTLHSFTTPSTDRILVWTPPGGNHPQRPDLMWVSEVKLLP